MPTLTKKEQELSKLFELPKAEDYLMNLSYDAVIFGFNGEVLKILVLEYLNSGVFALPGGFVKKNQDFDEAVKLGVERRTGISNIFLEQFHTFGQNRRDHPTIMKKIMKAQGYQIEDDHWLLGRFVTVGYYALVDYSKVELQPDVLSDSINWYPIDELPTLMMDHTFIVQKAIKALRKNLGMKLRHSDLLPEKFTMKSLQAIYEHILGEPLRRSSFQRKMLATDMLTRHEKLYTGGAHKAPYLYSFKPIDN